MKEKFLRYPSICTCRRGDAASLYKMLVELNSKEKSLFKTNNKVENDHLLKNFEIQSRQNFNTLVLE